MSIYTESEISIHNVLITFDVEALMTAVPNPSKNPDNPTFVSDPNKFIFMLTKKADTLSGHGGAELDFKASPSDIIRWRETTLERNTGKNIQLYKYTSNAADLLTKPSIQPVLVTVPVPNPDDHLHPVQFQKISDYFWQATVLDVGRVVYRFNFMVLKRDATPLGYFTWDPFITINN
jgi:nematocidal protein AidA